METAALWGLVALLLLIVAALLGPGLARDLARSLGGALPHAAPDIAPDARRARAAQPAAARADRPRPAAPRARARRHRRRRRGARLDELPPRRAVRAPAGAEPVLHVHVVHAAAGPVVELWTYYPDSQTSHLPLRRAARLPPRRLGGPDGRVRARRLAARRARLRAQRLQRHGAVVGAGRGRLGALRRRRLPRQRLARARLPARRPRPRRRRLERRPRDGRAGRVPARRGRSGRAARPQLRSRGRTALGEGRVAQSRHAPHEHRRRRAAAGWPRPRACGRRRTRWAPGEGAQRVRRGGA